MSIIHYFSKDSHKRALFIFNLIAPFYKLIDRYLNESFDEAAEILSKEIELNGLTILDIGTGTGAWASKFSKYKPANITGVDFSKKMITIAKKNYSNITFSQKNAEDLKEIPNQSFDIVTSSYVLHGMSKDERKIVLDEMKRVSKKYVIIHDFIETTTLLVRFLEFLERSDYPYFKDNFIKEMHDNFSSVKKIEVKDGAGLYIGEL